MTLTAITIMKIIPTIDFYKLWLNIIDIFKG